MVLMPLGKQEKTYEPIKKSGKPAEIAISPGFFRRTPAGTVGEPVFFQVGPPTTAINAFFSHSGFSLDPSTVLFLPFLISDAIENGCCSGVGGNTSIKEAFFAMSGRPDLTHKPIYF